MLPEDRVFILAMFALVLLLIWIVSQQAAAAVRIAQHRRDVSKRLVPPDPVTARVAQNEATVNRMHQKYVTGPKGWPPAEDV